MRPFLLPLTVVLAGCSLSGSPSGSLAGDQGDLGAATAAWAVVDLSNKSVAWRIELPDLASNPDYRDRLLVFRRIGSGSGECLVAAFETTQAQWRRLAAETPWTAVPTSLVPASGLGDDRPAFNLAYDDIVTALAGFHLAAGRLTVPTAAQWELAAGGSSGWAWGPTGTPAQLRATAWVRDTADGQAGPRAVGSGAATGAGFYDAHGNVWEWTAPGTQVRGGSWADDSSACRLERAALPGSGALEHALIGVRLVLVP